MSDIAYAAHVLVFPPEQRAALVAREIQARLEIDLRRLPLTPTMEAIASEIFQ